MFAWAANAQGDEAWKLYYDSTQLFWAKDWNKTVALLEHAEKSALTDLGIYDENYLTILNDLGTAYWKAKNFSKAEEVLSKSLSLKGEVYSADDKEVILSISNLAGFYAEQGKWGKSKSLYNLKKDNLDLAIEGYKKVIAEFDTLLTTSDPLYITALNNLATAYRKNNQPATALRYLEKADGLLKANGQANSDVAETRCGFDGRSGFR